MLDAFGARLALWAIRLYQRHLSPIKGYACPYRLVHGGAGCSGHGYRVIRDRGLWRGLALLDRRLARCTQARRSLAQARNPILGYQRGECDPGCGCDLHSIDCNPPSGQCISNLCDAFGCGSDILDCKRYSCNRWRHWRQQRRER